MKVYCYIIKNATRENLKLVRKNQGICFLKFCDHPNTHFHQLYLDARKPVFGGLCTTKVQTSLRICAVKSGTQLYIIEKHHNLDLLYMSEI